MKTCTFCEETIDENKPYLIIVELDQAPEFAHKNCLEEVAIDSWFHDHLE